MVMVNGKFRLIASCLRSWSGAHICFSVVSVQVDGHCQEREASATPGLWFTMQSSTAVTSLVY